MPDTEHLPREQLQSLIAEGDGEQLNAYVGELTTGETARALSNLEENDQARLLTLMFSAVHVYFQRCAGGRPSRFPSSVFQKSHNYRQTSVWAEGRGSQRPFRHFLCVVR